MGKEGFERERRDLSEKGAIRVRKEGRDLSDKGDLSEKRGAC